MATTDDYLAYLNDKIGIAPANSQEELQASQVIADVYRSHGLEPTVQEFDAPANTNLTAGVLFVIVFVGALLSGMPAGALSIIGALLAIAAVVLLAMRYFGNDVLGSYGPTIRSQNVIGYHQATGDLVAKGNRPIVIVAHYDTPRADIFYKEPFSQYQAMLKQASVVLVPVVGVLALFQLFGFLPGVLRGILWVVEIVCALPVLLWGVSIIARNFGTCTLGANDNKAAVAAMLGVLSNVRPSSADEAERLRESVAARKAAAPQESAEPEPAAVRHGEEVVRAIGILPESCEIVYVEPEPVEASVADDDEGMATEAFSATSELSATSSFEAPAEEAEEEPEQEASEEASDSDDSQTTQVSAPVEAPKPRRILDPSRIPGFRKATAPEVDADATVLAPPVSPEQEEPSEPEQPQQQPQQATGRSAGRRAALLDLPDPSRTTVDPLASDSGTDLSDVPDMDATVVVTPDVAPEEPVVSGEALDVITPEDLEAKQSRKRRGIFGRRKKKRGGDEESMSDWLGVDEDYDAKKNGRKIGSWDNLDGDDHSSGDGWKGGATQNGRFRVIEGNAPADEPAYDDAPAPDADEAPASGQTSFEIEEGAPDDEELRDAILSMGDDELICHDIWFVALGASEVGHAGMHAFLKDYRKMCRGAFLINLDCIGAGELSVLTEEGLDNRRKADRRLIRLLDSTAKDIHVGLAQEKMTWGDTDATPAMRTSMRSATIVGLDEHKLPAYERSAEDVEEVVDPAQVKDVCALVTEAIRRS